jgi:hypothetical protein
MRMLVVTAAVFLGVIGQCRAFDQAALDRCTAIADPEQRMACLVALAEEAAGQGGDAAGSPDASAGAVDAPAMWSDDEIKALMFSGDTPKMIIGHQVADAANATGLIEDVVADAEKTRYVVVALRDKAAGPGAAARLVLVPYEQLVMSPYGFRLQAVEDGTESPEEPVLDLQALPTFDPADGRYAPLPPDQKINE